MNLGFQVLLLTSLHAATPVCVDDTSHTFPFPTAALLIIRNIWVFVSDTLKLVEKPPNVVFHHIPRNTTKWCSFLWKLKYMGEKPKIKVAILLPLSMKHIERTIEKNITQTNGSVNIQLYLPAVKKRVVVKIIVEILQPRSGKSVLSMVNVNILKGTCANMGLF